MKMFAPVINRNSSGLANKVLPSCHAERSRAAVALESCIMAVIHNDVFDTLAQTHKTEDIALHGFLEKLMADQFEVCGTSPNLQVQVSSGETTCA